MAKQKNSVTPMMEQYLRLKKQYEGSLLFFRLGDFYEMFYEDARLASPVMEIALTTRQKVPMCGVPYHAADTYLIKLLKHGFKVAICEQVEDPATAKGVVRRDVVKVLTPGTAVELNLGEAKESTYLSSLYVGDQGWGLAVIDVAAGRILTSQGSDNEQRRLADELFRYSPREITFPEGQSESIQSTLSHTGLSHIIQSPQEDWIFDLSQAKNLLLDHFQVSSLGGFDLEDKPQAAAAAGALLYYLKALRKDSLAMIQNISYVMSSQYMVLDSISIRNLELIKNLRDSRRSGSLLDTLDYTVNAMGSRLLKSWLLQPLMDIEEIRRRQDAVAELVEATIERHEIRDSLAEISDLERLNGKVSLAVAHARDLVALKRSLLALPRMLALLETLDAQPLKRLKIEWDNAADIADSIGKAIKDEPPLHLTEGGIIRDGYAAELDELRKSAVPAKSLSRAWRKRKRKKPVFPL